MLSDEKRTDLDALLCANLFDDSEAERCTVDELLYASALMQKKGALATYVLSKLVEKIKEHPDWIVLWCEGNKSPLIHKSRIYIFTSARAAENACNQICQKGYHVVVKTSFLYEENIFHQAFRCGASEISVNKGDNGIVLDINHFLSQQQVYEKYGSEQHPALIYPELTLAAMQYVTASISSVVPDDAPIIEERFFKTLAKSSLLVPIHIEEGRLVPVAATSYTDGYEHPCYLVFSDLYEFKMSYMEKSIQAAFMNMDSLRKEIPDAEIILNPTSSNIILEHNVFEYCSEYISRKTRIVMEGLHTGKTKAEAEKAADEIMSYDDICSEYEGYLLGDEDSEPENPVRSGSYTANMLLRTMVETPFDAYWCLARIRNNHDDVLALK